MDQPDVAADPAPADKVSLSLNLRVEDGLHAVVVEAVGLAEVDDREAVRQVGPHVLNLGRDNFDCFL